MPYILCKQMYYSILSDNSYLSVHCNFLGWHKYCVISLSLQPDPQISYCEVADAVFIQTSCSI